MLFQKNTSKTNIKLSSILDNDFYKFTMQCAVVKLFPDERVRYQFINRGGHSFPEGFAKVLSKAVEAMAELRLSKEEKDFLKKNCPYLNLPYIDFLEGYRYDPSEVCIQQKGDQLEVSVTGFWYRTILWEVPLLSLISELLYKFGNEDRDSDQVLIQRTREKKKRFEDLGVPFAEFGTRRRYSYEVHRLVMETLSSGGGSVFSGSSNVHMASLFNVKPIGTHAHEWFMFHGCQYGFEMANILSLEHWVDIYRGDLGIALSDTYTTDIFFQQFDKKFAKLFDGVRHDSGDPIKFAEKTIKHYEKNGINPLFKYIIFSDDLNIAKVEEITKACKGKIGISFGMGTHLTNDVGVLPSNIVMKMTGVLGTNGEWIPTVKLSDEEKKYTGTPEMIQLAKEVLRIGESRQEKRPS